MSTEIYEDSESGTYVTRYFGGTERGVCFQIGGDNDDRGWSYVQLTQEQAKKVANAILGNLMEPSGEPGASHE